MFELKNDFSTAKVRIYAAGGGGINSVSELMTSTVEPKKGFASFVPCYIDTSDSNLRGKKFDPDETYLFKGIDGSGKVRSMNYEDISKNAKAILLEHKPCSFNIVVHTASGGSGSVIGPVLVSELKARNEQVVAIVIGSTDTRIEIENTIKTLKSYESIAEKRNSPVVVMYLENTQTDNRNVVNQKVKFGLSMLSGLYSEQISELDSADLKNWLDYTKITKTSAKLASLVITVTEKELMETEAVISVATIALPEMSTRLDITPAYQCVGYAPNEWRYDVPNSLHVIADAPIHYTISDDFIIHSTNKLNRALKDLDDVFNSRNARDSILDKNDNKTDSGLVL